MTLLFNFLKKKSKYGEIEKLIEEAYSKKSATSFNSYREVNIYLRGFIWGVFYNSGYKAFTWTDLYNLNKLNDDLFLSKDNVYEYKN